MQRKKLIAKITSAEHQQLAVDMLKMPKRISENPQILCGFYAIL